jgi:hypothetical protein
MRFFETPAIRHMADMPDVHNVRVVTTVPASLPFTNVFLEHVVDAAELLFWKLRPARAEPVGGRN